MAWAAMTAWQRLKAAARQQIDHAPKEVLSGLWWFLIATGVLLGAIPTLMLSTVQTIMPAVLALLGVLLGAAIAAITNIITAHATRKTQIGAATWSKRFETHQTAFAIWVGIMDASDKPDELKAALFKARIWWSENCLYLSDKSREEFSYMIKVYPTYLELLKIYRGRSDEKGNHLIAESWDAIRRVGETLSYESGGHVSDGLLNELSKKSALN